MAGKYVFFSLVFKLNSGECGKKFEFASGAEKYENIYFQ